MPHAGGEERAARSGRSAALGRYRIWAQRAHTSREEGLILFVTAAAEKADREAGERQRAPKLAVLQEERSKKKLNLYSELSACFGWLV